MSKPSGVRHANYEMLNLIGYGLAKFETDLVAALGFRTKVALFTHLIKRGVASTTGTLKNRQDLFNPLVRQAKIGWWQNGDRYLHRKVLLDSLFGDLDAAEYAQMVRGYLRAHFPVAGEVVPPLIPLLQSKFRSMQETGLEAELYFMHRFSTLAAFANGVLADARLFGDGYDFQITLPGSHTLVDVKGVRKRTGTIRLTEKEHQRAGEYADTYCLVVVSRLEEVPRMTAFFDPLRKVAFTRQSSTVVQVQYTSPSRLW